jgi:DNA-binding NarL/FixJ family response regulator
MSTSPSSAIRVLLVDDHAMVRETLGSALRAYANIEVVGEARDGDEALACMERLKPAVVVMDINMSRMDGITATRLIKAQYPQIAVVGLSAEGRGYTLSSMLRVGASEVVHKDNVAATLYGAIQKAVAAVQPILIMEDGPVSEEQKVEEVEPSSGLMSNTQPHEEKNT